MRGSREVYAMAPQPSNTKPIQVLLIGFQAVIQEGLGAILSHDPDMECLRATVTDAAQAVLELKRLAGRGSPVDVVLIPTRIGALDGVQTTRLVKESFPDIAVLVFTEQDNDSRVIDAIHAGGAAVFEGSALGTDTHRTA